MLRMILIFTLVFTTRAQELFMPEYYLGIFVKREGYYLKYNEKHEQASWVAYILKGETLKIPYERKGSFKKDPMVYSGTATKDDYYKSGYDRGHLAPARDFPQNTTETFFYSNASPQLPGFNRGVWKRLENFVRQKAIDLNKIYITTGPVLKDSLKSIGPEEVSVPEAFYKVILYAEEGKEPEGIGFILAHESSSADLETFAVTVDSVEVLTGIDFFSGLSAEDEKKTESTFNKTFWGF